MGQGCVREVFPQSPQIFTFPSITVFECNIFWEQPGSDVYVIVPEKPSSDAYVIVREEPGSVVCVIVWEKPGSDVCLYSPGEALLGSLCNSPGVARFG